MAGANPKPDPWRGRSWIRDSGTARGPSSDQGIAEAYSMIRAAFTALDKVYGRRKSEARPMARPIVDPGFRYSKGPELGPGNCRGLLDDPCGVHRAGQGVWPAQIRSPTHGAADRGSGIPVQQGARARTRELPRPTR